MFKFNRRVPMAVLLFGLALPTFALADPDVRGGAVFIMSNAASGNEVIAFERASNGSLNEGRRYDTGGRGSSGINDPLGSQGSLTLSQDHSELFAVNAGSGDISVFKVHHSSLDLLEKVPSGGSEPVAVTQHQNLVYVLNAGGAGSVVGFKMDFDKHLRQIKGSTTFLTATASGGASITFSPDGRFLVVTEKVPNNIDVFPVRADGTLGPIVVNPGGDPGGFSAAFAPNGALIVSATGTPGIAGSATIASYLVLASGKVEAISQHVPTDGTANCWNAITPDGRFVYVSNAGSSSISGFAIGKDGSLTPLPGTVVGNNPLGSTNLDIAVSADGKYVYTLNSATGNIGVFGVEQDGTLRNLGSGGEYPKADGFNGIASL